ncbi:hypothetical protein ACQ5SO_06625 [Rhodovulum sp. DZ06]|uniref:hypothetical protein n=1 Tax=Rhodovulum sp. DZ06 TaxID=3425126 RepID=UPI003D34AED4
MTAATRKAAFRNADMAWDMSALVLFPPEVDETGAWPTIVSVHPFGSCWEQTSSAVYGAAPGQEGFVTIAHDGRFQGESGGAPAGSRTRRNGSRTSAGSSTTPSRFPVSTPAGSACSASAAAAATR